MHSISTGNKATETEESSPSFKNQTDQIIFQKVPVSFMAEQKTGACGSPNLEISPTFGVQFLH